MRQEQSLSSISRANFRPPDAYSHGNSSWSHRVSAWLTRHLWTRDTGQCQPIRGQYGAQLTNQRPALPDYTTLASPAPTSISCHVKMLIQEQSRVIDWNEKLKVAALYLFFLASIMMGYEVHGSEYCWLGITVNNLWPVTAW